MPSNPFLNLNYILGVFWKNGEVPYTLLAIKSNITSELFQRRVHQGHYPPPPQPHLRGEKKIRLCRSLPKIAKNRLNSHLPIYRMKNGRGEISSRGERAEGLFSKSKLNIPSSRARKSFKIRKFEKF